MHALASFGFSLALAVAYTAPASQPVAPAQQTIESPGPSRTAPASPSPHPAATSLLEERGTLKEIGRVRAVTPFCKAIVERAAVAVGSAFESDQRIFFLIDDLQNGDFDSNILRKTRNMNALSRQYLALRSSILEGEHAIRDLRDRANTSANPDEKQELLSFANSLGGALSRQHKMLRDLNGLLAFMESFEIDDEAFWTSSFYSNHRLAPFVHGAANDFAEREASAIRDEGKAADHADAAFKRCASALPDALESPEPVPTPAPIQP